MISQMSTKAGITIRFRNVPPLWNMPDPSTPARLCRQTVAL
jgi:hypothetical protein